MLDLSEHSTARSPIPASTRELVVACASVLAVFLAGVSLKASGWSWPGDDAWRLGGDFSAFYVAGRMLNEHDGARLYDFDRQAQSFREAMPGSTAPKLPFFNPPLVAAVFRPLARLPLSTALAIFLASTFLLFLASLWLLTSTFGPSTRDERALALLAGLSFFPFLGYTWLGAQISVLGFAAIVLALREEDRGREFSSGLALSLCLYKPSLLTLLVPMLLFTRRFRHLLGFVAGGATLALASLVLAGPEATLVYLDRTGWLITRATTQGDAAFSVLRYVDLNAFFRLLPYGRSPIGYVTLAAIAISAATAILTTWMRSSNADRHGRLLMWAATLTWSLVLNIYTPFYDTILVVAAGVIAVAAVRARAWRGWNRLAPALASVYVTPWIAEICARTFRVQIYTVVLGAFGTLLLVEANRPVAATLAREQRRHERGAI